MQQQGSASEENWKIRVKLATAYRALEDEKLNHGILNHLTALAPAANGEGRVMLLNRFGLLWSEVTPSNLLGLNDKNEVVEGRGEPFSFAVNVHRAIYDTRPDIRSVMHLHPHYATALACLKDPTLEMCTQMATRFYENLAYDHHFSGLASNYDEGLRLAKELGNNNALLMSNHGCITVGDTVDEAFFTVTSLEIACHLQITAKSTGKEMKPISQDILKLMQEQRKKGNLDKNVYALTLKGYTRKYQRECLEFELASAKDF